MKPENILTAILLVLVLAICVSATSPDSTSVSYTHDGTCVCDGLDPNCTNTVLPSDDIQTYKDFQLDYQYNGDIIIYTMEDEMTQIYVGTYKHGSKCDLQAIMNKWMEDND